MPTYKVTDNSGMGTREIHPGDIVTDFRGDSATFESVSRGKEYNGTAKVIVTQVYKGIASQREYYAQVFNLNVTTLA